MPQRLMRAFCAWLWLAWALACSPVLAQVVATFGPKPAPVIIPETYQGEKIQLRTWLQTPIGPGPFNTVVLIPGCNGVDRNGWAQMRAWADWLMQLNYAALIIDSFTPRNVTNTCGEGKGKIVPGELHAADFYTAAAYISHLPQLQGGKIGGIGFSHGGWGVLEAASNRSPGIVDLRARLVADHVGIAALVAFYPACFRHINAQFQVPLLILIGAKDDWTPAFACESLAANASQDGSNVRLKVYPNAFHVFDVQKPPRVALGHELRYDPTAAADAHREVQEFFAYWFR